MNERIVIPPGDQGIDMLVDIIENQPTDNLTLVVATEDMKVRAALAAEQQGKSVTIEVKQRVRTELIETALGVYREMSGGDHAIICFPVLHDGDLFACAVQGPLFAIFDSVAERVAKRDIVTHWNALGRVLKSKPYMREVAAVGLKLYYELVSKQVHSITCFPIAHEKNRYACAIMEVDGDKYIRVFNNESAELITAKIEPPETT